MGLLRLYIKCMRKTARASFETIYSFIPSAREEFTVADLQMCFVPDVGSAEPPHAQ